ncbi:NAD(P)H-binding protein [Nocardia sp. AG03]|uniref:NAD(P)H-binding protein n=1 Tax=Nocardia sp. AG03 TaxID=3025312 RepID=UPI0024186E75|nr:NAD(P)H-binding protein [Nocardia sp. AG03]
MIVVTGATGNIGRPLVEALVAAGERVTAVSRGVTGADVPAGVRWQQADLAEPTDLAAAFEGAESLFLLTSGDFVADGGQVTEVMDIAKGAGIRRVVLLSSQGVGTGSHPSAMEDTVRESGVEWTMLRPGGFASNAVQWAESVRARRMVAAPFGDVALPVIDPTDIAAVAAVTLLDSGHGGRAYDLTGPVAISPREQVADIAAALGEPVRFIELSRAEAKAEMVRFMPEHIVESTLDILGSPKPVERQVSPDVERLLGRAPRTFAEWVARNSAAFA